eukprot:TRINITY_DN9245_c0_g1_i1.p1 TRINITY_DN9245_c0_g1~~TRINITY_DN9245_c0_g1_i1.p1  ORF type:complete len:804 (+),score=248.47 TRINITY_DN9245_c0_g1_i1:38-2413(+)
MDHQETHTPEANLGSTFSPTSQSNENLSSTFSGASKPEANLSSTFSGTLKHDASLSSTFNGAPIGSFRTKKGTGDDDQDTSDVPERKSFRNAVKFTSASSSSPEWINSVSSDELNQKLEIIGDSRKAKTVGFVIEPKKGPLFHPAPASQNKPSALSTLTTKTAVDFIKKQIDLGDKPKNGPRSDPAMAPLLSIKTPRRMSIAQMAPVASSNGLELIMRSSRTTDEDDRMSRQLMEVKKEVYSVPDVAWKVFWKASTKKDKPINLGREKAVKVFKIPSLSAGTWKFEGWTTDKLSKLPIRSICVSLMLVGSNGMVIFSGEKLYITTTNEMYRYQFDVLENCEPATLEVSAVCPHLIKMPFKATVSQCVPVDEGDAPDIELFDPAKLTGVKKEKYEYACSGWSDIDAIGVSPLTYDHSRAIFEMSRPSKYRQKAEKSGMIRPFLLLVSMHPHRRIFWSKAIGIDVMNKRCFPNPHKEAWYIITKHKTGMKDRTTDAYGEKLNPFARTTNWYEVIYRVSYTVFVKRVVTEGMMKNTEVTKEIRKVIKECKKSYRTGMAGCSDPDQAPIIRMLEEAFMIAFMHKMKDRLLPEKQHAMERLVEESPESMELRNRLLEAGWRNSDLISFAVGIMLYKHPRGIIMEMIGYATSKKDSDALEYATIIFPLIFIFVSPIPYIPMAMLARSAIGYLLKPDPGALLPIVFGICIQRMWLSFAGLRVEDFYVLKGDQGSPTKGSVLPAQLSESMPETTILYPSQLSADKPSPLTVTAGGKVYPRPQGQAATPYRTDDGDPKQD